MRRSARGERERGGDAESGEAKASSLRPDAFCFNICIDACAKGRLHEKARALLGVMRSDGVAPDVIRLVVVFIRGGVAVLHAFAVRPRVLERTRHWFRQDGSPTANCSFLLRQRWLKNSFPILSTLSMSLPVFVSPLPMPQNSCRLLLAIPCLPYADMRWLSFEIQPKRYPSSTSCDAITRALLFAMCQHSVRCSFV